jgi:hypothetical protein
MKTTLRASLLAVLLLPGLASAQVSLGLRAGYALPFGDAYEQSGLGTFKQSELTKGVLPLQLDATWRFNPSFTAGLYLSYGFGQIGTKLKELCATSGSSCKDPSIIRYGAQGAYTFEATGKLEPWLGLAIGVEQASFGVKNFVYGTIPGTPPTVLAADLDGTLRGWEAGVEGGADYRVSPSFAIGPLLSFSVGQYTVQHITLAGQGTVAGGGVDTAKTHEWLTLGVRGRFDL